MDFIEKTQLAQYQAEAEVQTKEMMMEEYTQDNEQQEDLKDKALQLMGRLEALSTVNSFVGALEISQLKDIKETKVYKHLNLTWDEFCKKIGISRSKADEDIANFKILGEQFIKQVSSLGFGYRDIRKFNCEAKNGALEIKDNNIIIEGEIISFDEKEALKDALADLVLKNKEEQDQLKAELKAKDKVIHDYALAKEQSDTAYTKIKAEKDAFQKQAEEFKNKFNNVFTGTLKGVPDGSKEQMAELIKFENNLQLLIHEAYRLMDEDLTEFNGNVLCSLLAQAMITFDDIRVKAGARYKFIFEGGILTNEELNSLNNIDENTPLDFLK